MYSIYNSLPESLSMQKDWPRLLKMLHEELGYTVREGKPALGYDLFHVDLSSWKLRLPNRTPVVWVKTKDLDSVSAQHVMQSLADVVRERNLSRQIVLVLLDGNSYPLLKHKTSLNYNLVLIGAEEQKNVAQSLRPSGELLDLISA